MGARSRGKVNTCPHLGKMQKDQIRSLQLPHFGPQKKNQKMTRHILRVQTYVNAFAAGALPWTPLENLRMLSQLHLSFVEGRGW